METQDSPIIFSMFEQRFNFYRAIKSGEIPTEKAVFKESRGIREHFIDTYIEGLRETIGYLYGYAGKEFFSKNGSTIYCQKSEIGRYGHVTSNLARTMKKIY